MWYSTSIRHGLGIPVQGGGTANASVLPRKVRQDGSASIDLGHVQHVVDQPGQTFRFGLEDGDKLAPDCLVTISVGGMITSEGIASKAER